jgi:hypothetical protein
MRNIVAAALLLVAASAMAGNNAAPQDEVLEPHGEERGIAARLEPCGHGNHTQVHSAAVSS